MYRDRVRVVVAGREHDWPCDFIQTPGSAADQPLPVLGRAGFLAEYEVCITGNYLILTRPGPIRRWLRDRLHELWKRLGMVHPADRPL